uniref:Peptidase S1 domain-containing protein n=1 Tax=Panagrolaimus sp. JU765 TaxID=591449 RepID=A0AC34QJJ3_9BILA
MGNLCGYAATLYLLTLLGVSTAQVRIFNGTIVPVGKLTHVVEIFVYADGNNRAFECTATIVSEYWLLTSAWCMQYNALEARISKNNDSKGCYSLVAYEFHIHPDYDKNTSAHNIGLIRSNVSLISPLAATPGRLGANYSHQGVDWLLVAGYGGSEGNFRILMQTYLQAVSKRNCPYLNDPFVNRTSVNGICLFRTDSSISGCDDGGPAMAKGKDGQWYQVGITNFRKTFSTHVLNVATDVNYYCPWIEETTKGEVKCQAFEPVDIVPDLG